MVLGDGEVRNASPDDPETSELFWAAAASFGTMGVVTLLELELVEAKPFVELTYQRISGVEDAVQRFEAEKEADRFDYMDGILFAEDHGVVCLGKLVDAVSAEVKTFSKPWDDWFYINAETMLADASLHTWTEYIPIQDYLFRYERGAFWISKYTYRYFAVPLNRFTRWLLDTYTHTRVMYSALHHSGLSSKYIIQDVAIPYKNTSTFVSYLDTNFRNYPLWLCPLRMPSNALVPVARLGQSSHRSLRQTQLLAPFSLRLRLPSTAAFGIVEIRQSAVHGALPHVAP